MSKLLTREDLDSLRCGMPDCTEEHGPLYLHGRCHVEAHTETRYEDGAIVVTCYECGAEVARILVA